ncbi:MAG TPA: hypothetical protein VFS20_08175 [Longimicrobium sp.]|nr:hypothetical protein [Longimicrobium sp.]
MTKLKLQIDNLQVESFETAGTRAELRGTVAAHMPKPGGTTLQETQITGSCCDITLALSCVQTNCLECNVVTANTCAI